jgi:putative two-component system response regulator
MEIFPPVKPTILLVDDTPANLRLIAGLLRPYYTVKAVNDGEKAIRLCQDDPPDLILLDVMMPDVDGYEVCRRLKSNPRTSTISVIFLTSKTDPDNEQLGMDIGAVDYITRPISPHLLLSRVRAQFIEASHTRTLRINNEYLEYEVTKQTRQLMALQNVTMLALASLAETRDAETGNHLKRTQHYMLALGKHLAQHPRFADALSGDRVQALYRCAPLHDIGKVGIPDRILLKPGIYTAEEYEIMKTHPRLGRDALLTAQGVTDERMEFLEIAKDIVYCHHEKWDGSGYPQGLKGEAIPVSARLMALADVYDALRSRRVYKDGMSHENATAVIVKTRGTHFDPDVVDAFLALDDVFMSIATQFADSDFDLRKSEKFLNPAG